MPIKKNTKDQTLVEQMQTLERLGVYYKTAGVNIAEDILPALLRPLPGHVQ